MHGKKAFVGTLAAMTLCAAPPDKEVSFSGASAIEFTRKVVAYGPRPPGSEANSRLQAYIKSQLKLHGWEIQEDAFTADTPIGPIAMRNLIGRKAGTSGRAVVLTGHFDTKLMAESRFVGANDGGSSTGFLLEMARVMAHAPLRDDLYLVWFDGEEAIRQWSASDGVYGSRHLALRWSKDGTLGRIKALINVDMIGDKDLDIMQEMNSTAWLRQLVWQAAREIGYGKYFLENGGGTEDDHAPFLKLGVSALDLIDFDYGPNGSYWHTEHDTMDKLGAHSFQVVGDVLVEILRRLEKR